MTTLFLWMGFLTILLLLILIVPLCTNRAKKQKESLPQINVDIYRDQFKELENELARGAISQQEYDEGREELERRVLEDTAVDNQVSYSNGKAGIYTAFAFVLLVPFVAAAMWLMTQPLGDFRLDGGKYEGIVDYNTGQVVKNTGEMHDMASAILKLKQHLDAEPGDINGWMMYGRTLLTLRKYPQAADAFEHALHLAPGNPVIMVDLADAIAMVQNQDLAGRPWELVNKALSVDPTNWKALMMGGTDYFNHGDYRMAVMYWERLLKHLSPNDNLVPAVKGSIQEARSLGQIVGPVQDTLPFGKPHGNNSSPVPMVSQMMQGGNSAMSQSIVPGDGHSPEDHKVEKAKPTHAISGIVELSPDLIEKVGDHTTLYVTARPASGSRAPIAQFQMKVLDFPAHFTVDNTMTPPMDMGAGTLDQHKEVIVTARLGKAGSIMPAAGDLEGTTGQPIPVNSKDVRIILNKVR